ncbi:hypothetical protein QPL79_08965 [Ignisphaera sp. 4213-co]|uniref:Uncharacterized protein n=1 Tax=Ignisphaera cupida TaxID=3050454 RepID=A0ABD4ZAA4_9CREN|nr:hypothetical protein [Ignisphaera sp. 4213-co]MDK6029493.1 hypothetical protein [Ignisphaera sp. 4213-co]
MHLKKESRILIVDVLNDKVIGVVLRGLAGIEETIILSDCEALKNFCIANRVLQVK